MRCLGCLAGVTVALGFVFLSPVSLRAEAYPGAFFVGDSGNGDGFIDGSDLANLRSCAMGIGGGYPGVRPPSCLVQELDGDAYILATDISIMRSWVTNNYANYAAPTSLGKAYGIGLFTPVVTIDTSVSDIVELKAWTYDFVGAGDGHSTPRAGYGIVFEIDPASPCPGAFLYGRDPTPLLSDPTDTYVSGATVYEYTDVYATPPATTVWWPPNEAKGGIAQVELNAGTCPGGTVLINVYIPSDAEAIKYGRGSWGRFWSRLDAPDQIMATILVP